jgi:trimethylamine--corrinoid protein Co-methyltransferase
MRIEILDKSQIEKIHEKALEILENTGFIVPHEEVLNRFNEFGAVVDYKSKLVKISPSLVCELIKKPMKTFTLYGRDLTKKAEFGKGKRNYNSSAGQTFWFDELGSSRRYPNINDVDIATRFADGLSQINIVGAMADPHEIPIAWRCLAVASTMIKNTEKPISFWYYDRKSAKLLNELLLIVRGDTESAKKYPLFYPLFEPISPLSFPFHGVDLLFETSRLNLPVHIGPMAQMGVSAPPTIVGTLTQENAEILAAICITQLIQEGMPICYGGICHAFDMKTVQIIFGGPEQAMYSIAMTQMGKFYGFPVYINAGLTDSKDLDAQAGLESGITLALGASSGADIFGHMGICGMDQGASLDILTMQAEIISYVEVINKTIDVAEDAFFSDFVNQVGPKGSFLNDRRTAKVIRDELWFPSLLDRNGYEKWVKKGSTTMKSRCQAFKNAMLKKCQTQPLEADIDLEIQKLLNKAKKELSN